jgi:hypothetical protein
MLAYQRLYWKLEMRPSWARVRIITTRLYNLAIRRLCKQSEASAQMKANVPSNRLLLILVSSIVLASLIIIAYRLGNTRGALLAGCGKSRMVTRISVLA